MLNSLVYCYVIVGCINGKVYVWDIVFGCGFVYLLEYG